ncbi:MAG: flagellar biosynthesis protein FliQ [Candidatus Sumerlaeota bacterium]|nr:flagellar biosynthesis protein FliQ [Candidatus Sumerlaeota bacterium]
MDPQTFIDFMQESFRVSLFLSLPILGAALVTGILVSVFQTITSIQEQTLVFVPKMLAVLAALILLFSFMLRTLMNFTYAVFAMIPNLAR